MIPKVIHYIWFGKGEMPKLMVKCIESWKKNLPGYEIMEWNEDNFDVTSNPFVKQAYESRKFAFVSDYVRLHALYHYGGIYMDTDVEVIRPLDRFLQHAAFTGFEDNQLMPTGTVGAVKGHPWVGRLLQYYDGREFIRPDGSLDMVANTDIITEITKQDYDLVCNNQKQTLRDDLHIYPSEYFSPKDYESGEVRSTANTHTIHHFAGSWLSSSERNRKKITWMVRNALRSLLGEWLYDKSVKVAERYIRKMLFGS